jgi:ComF family protein
MRRGKTVLEGSPIKLLKVKNHLQKIEKEILDILLPKKCFDCGKEGCFWCSKCLEKIKINSWQICPICEKYLTEKGKICNYCDKSSLQINSLTVATDYNNPKISKAITLLKYKFIPEMAKPLAQILLKTYQKNNLKIPDLIIPVPLHPIKLRWRGFNQSELLADYFSEIILPNFKIKVDKKTLIRSKYTQPQASFKKSKDRIKNIENAFQVNFKNLNKIKNRRLLLIDDVCTTASTLNECAKKLRILKPKSIQALVIARRR